MPFANVRGAHINYKVLGGHGPWLALSPGGRRDMSAIEPLAKHVADLRIPCSHPRPAQLRRLRCSDRW